MVSPKSNWWKWKQWPLALSFNAKIISGIAVFIGTITQNDFQDTWTWTCLNIVRSWTYLWWPGIKIIVKLICIVLRIVINTICTFIIIAACCITALKKLQSHSSYISNTPIYLVLRFWAFSFRIEPKPILTHAPVWSVCILTKFIWATFIETFFTFIHIIACPKRIIEFTIVIEKITWQWYKFFVKVTLVGPKYRNENRKSRY